MSVRYLEVVGGMSRLFVVDVEYREYAEFRL